MTDFNESGTVEHPEFVTTKDDGQTEKYWDPAWGDEGAAPQGVSLLNPHEDEAEAD